MEIVHHMLKDLAREYKQQHVDEEEVKALEINDELHSCNGYSTPQRMLLTEFPITNAFIKHLIGLELVKGILYLLESLM